jgi:hypothetical protein
VHGILLFFFLGSDLYVRPQILVLAGREVYGGTTFELGVWGNT